MMNTSNANPPTRRYVDIVTASFVGTLLISNIASTKILEMGPFTFDGGTILFPLAYIFGDILTEVYGYRRSRKVIWIGFIWLLLAAIIFAVVDVLPPAEGWDLQNSFHAILGQTPRIVVASLVAYLVGEFANSIILARLKVLSRGRWLWLRTITSTLVGQGFDTGVFLVIAFWGVLPVDLLQSVFISNYIFKCGVEVFCTPITYWAVNFLKRAENEDYYDYHTDFNPFNVGES